MTVLGTRFPGVPGSRQPVPRAAAAQNNTNLVLMVSPCLSDRGPDDGETPAGAPAVTRPIGFRRCPVDVVPARAGRRTVIRRPERSVSAGRRDGPALRNGGCTGPA